MRYQKDPTVNPTVSDYFEHLGIKGGKASGQRKKRSPDHYKRLSQLGVQARASKAACVPKPIPSD